MKRNKSPYVHMHDDDAFIFVVCVGMSCKRRKKVTFNIPDSPIPNEGINNFSSSNNTNSSISFRHWCIAPVNPSFKFTLDPKASALLKRRRERQSEEKRKMLMENNKL